MPAYITCLSKMPCVWTIIMYRSCISHTCIFFLTVKIQITKDSMVYSRVTKLSKFKVCSDHSNKGKLTGRYFIRRQFSENCQQLIRKITATVCRIHYTEKIQEKQKQKAVSETICYKKILQKE